MFITNNEKIYIIYPFLFFKFNKDCKRMNILYIHCAPDLYGSSRSLLRLIKKQIEDGYVANVILPYNGLLCDELRKIGAGVFVTESDPTLRKSKFKNIRSLLLLMYDCGKSFFRFRRIAKITNSQLIHTNTSVSIMGGFVAKLLKIRHICHVRESYTGFGPLWLLYRKYLLTFSDIIICVSKAMANQFPEKTIDKKVFTVYNGFPVNEFPYVKQNDIDEFKKQFNLNGHILIGLVGRIILVRKGQDVFVKAAKIVKEQYPNVRFLIVGSTYPGNEYHLENLKKIISECNVHNEIILTGELTNTKIVYAAIDISIMASATPEPFGGVTIESMAYGKPVIATNIGGNPEQIINGQTGMLVPPNDPVALAKAMIHLIENPEIRLAMGDNGRRRFLNEFTFDLFYSKIRTFISSFN